MADLDKAGRATAIALKAEDAYGPPARHPERSKLYEAVAKAFTSGPVARPTALELVELLQPTATAVSILPSVKTEAVDDAVVDGQASPPYSPISSPYSPMSSPYSPSSPAYGTLPS